MVRAVWSVFMLVCLWNGAFGLPPGDPNSWEIQISLFTPSAKDTQNFVRIDPAANDGLDSKDVLDPPPLPGRLSLSVAHEDGLARAGDVRPPLVYSNSWNLTATNLEPGVFHFFLFSGIISVPAEYSLTIIDTTAGVRHDLRSSPEYLFLPGPGEKERAFQLQVSNLPPRPPEELAATPGESCADLIWSEGSDPDVVGYNVYMGTAAGVYDTSWYVGMRSDFQVTDLEYGCAYFFAVSAVDRSSLEGGLSPETQISMQVDPTPTPEPAPKMTFDLDQNGDIDYRDLFSLAASWMAPVRLTPEGQRPVFRNVNPSLLNGFLADWRTFRPGSPAEKPVPLPTPDGALLGNGVVFDENVPPMEETSDGS